MKPSESHTPITIEQLIVGVKNKEIGPKVLIQAMLDNDFFIACSEKALTDREMILPICTEFNGEKTVCVFTRKEWAEAYMTTAVSVINLLGLEWLKQHPAKYGLIINPNHDVCVKFSVSGMENILEQFVKKS